VEEYEIQKEQVTKAMRALNDVSLGAIPGGGLAYLNCIPAVEAAVAACLDREEAEGIRLVANALSAPFRQIVGNYGGIHPPLALAEVQRPGASSSSTAYGFDALRGDYGDLATRGILDSTRIMLAALDAAMSVATMAITTEIVVSL
jgi:chaperonin GroEL